MDNDLNIDEYNFQEEINRFKEHDKKSEELYSSFKELFDISLIKSKNSISAFGSLKDLSEVARSLSSIRGDAISATSQAFNAKFKIAELKIKQSKLEQDETDAAIASSLMRDLTETLHKNIDVKQEQIPKNLDSSKKLKERISKDINSGVITLNNNEKSMKYDFIGGISYSYDNVNGVMVVLDSNNNPIPDYPLERIPEDRRFKKNIDGVAYDNSGREIKQIN